MLAEKAKPKSYGFSSSEAFWPSAFFSEAMEPEVECETNDKCVQQVGRSVQRGLPLERPMAGIFTTKEKAPGLVEASQKGWRLIFGERPIELVFALEPVCAGL